MMRRRQAGRVVRYHTYPILQQQTVGEHVWQVLRIYYEVWGPPEPHVFEYVLHHDSAERVTGDTPHHAKRLSPKLRAALHELEDAVRLSMGVPTPELTEEETRMVKLADLLEMWEFGQDECLLGSAHGELITQEVGRVLLDMLDKNPDERVTDYMRWRQTECRTPIT